MGALIDTSILISLERSPEPEASFSSRLANLETAISVVTVSELLHGVHRAATPLRRSARQERVEWFLNHLRVLPFDLPVARIHALIWADLAARGVSVGRHDLIIAATAVHHGLDLITLNRAEFARIEGLRLRDW